MLKLKKKYIYYKHTNILYILISLIYKKTLQKFGLHRKNLKIIFILLKELLK